MYQLHWYDKDLWQHAISLSQPSASKLNKALVSKTMLLNWQEHCTECAVPECYTYCPLYVKRADGNCRRFTYGIYPNPNFKGLLNFGADIRFKIWGKLEADLRQSNIGLTPRGHQLFQKIISFSPAMNSIFYRCRQFKKLFHREPDYDYDDFILECYSSAPTTIRLILECYDPTDHNKSKKMKFRHAFAIHPGMNFYALPAKKFDLGSFRYIYLYPDYQGPDARLIFTWLDFVKYRRVKITDHAPPAAKVKCVAWDLDNVLWDGILAESKKDDIMLKPSSIALIKQLDERGILNTIVSKNNYDHAWPMIEKAELADYFIYPVINWGQKSENLKNIAAKININLDTLALIDDSAFERHEVSSNLPQVRTYSDQEIPKLLDYPEFNVPVTTTSKNRRSNYLTQIKREQVQTSFAGNYDEFLRSCQMTMKIFVPEQEKDINRCLELIQRSNQLNLSAHRYSAAEFTKLIKDPDIFSLAFQCQDKFGDYGLVGFVSLTRWEIEPTIMDFVLSCRVAQKKVEHAFFAWLAKLVKQQNKTQLLAELIPTGKNGPLAQVFEDMKFKQLKKDQEKIILALSLDHEINAGDIIKVESNIKLRI